MANIEKTRVIPLKGRLITASDGTEIGENFKALTNMRYTPTAIEGINGMTKINTSVMDATYLKTRNGFHFRKSQPAESHVLVQAYNTGLTASQILENTTAIPSAGNFAATELHTDSSTGRGRFSDAPNGHLAYCNSAETMLWGGDEAQVGAFINYAPDGSFNYDFTKAVQNTETDAQNLATLARYDTSIDANVMLLLSLNNNVTDTSPTTIHTVTNVGSKVTFSTTEKKFGTHGAVFTTDAQLTIPDNADFDFSGGSFTVDGWFEFTDMSANNTIYYQETDGDNYFHCYVGADGAAAMIVQAAASPVVSLSTPTGSIVADTRYHIEFVENDSDWYILIDGKFKAYSSDANNCADYNQVVRIGYDGSTYAEMNIDEFRVSNTNRHVREFQVPSSAYGTYDNSTYFYIGAIQPLKGFKLTVSTVNTATSTMSVDYWNGSTWTGVSSLSDGTSSGGKSLAQTGSVTFTSTASTAKIKVIDGLQLYFYRVIVGDAIATSAISHVTVAENFQNLNDIWDGFKRNELSFQVYEDSVYKDYTLNVFENVYDADEPYTHATLDALTTSTEYVVVGFGEQMMGINVGIGSGKANTEANAFITVSYWNGTAWISVGTVLDGTAITGSSMAQSGTITWNAVASQNEFTREIDRALPLYYYKLAFAATLSANVDVFFASGIPAQADIPPHKFPFFGQDRLWLCSQTGNHKNAATCSSVNTTNVFNGFDSLTLYFGDNTELTAAASIFTQIGSTFYNPMVFTKANQTWVVIGSGPGDWVRYPISLTEGCTAPLTMTVINVPAGMTEGLTGTFAVWQGADGIKICDARNVLTISGEIANRFDPNDSGSINTDKIGDSIAFFDEKRLEYHWLFAAGSATTLDTEMVYSFLKPGWFEVNRGANRDIQCGVGVTDTYGNKFNYGTLDTGYMERLEYGTDFDSVDIDHVVTLGDIALEKDNPFVKTTMTKVGLITTSKETDSTITMTHTGDTKDSGTDYTMSQANSGYRMADPDKGMTAGRYRFHNLSFAVSTDDETIGFDPTVVAVKYKTHTGDF